MILMDAFGAAPQRLGRLLAVAELPEIGRKAQLLLLGDVLAAEHQHEMLPPGLLDRPHRGVGKLLGEINAADLCPTGARERRNREIDDVLHGRSSSNSH